MHMFNFTVFYSIFIYLYIILYTLFGVTAGVIYYFYYNILRISYYKMCFFPKTSTPNPIAPRDEISRSASPSLRFFTYNVHA